MTEEGFAGREGTVLIPRIEEDVRLNSKFPHGVGNEPKPGRFRDYQALTLEVRQVGLLESLHFAESKGMSSPTLGCDEIEIKVMASSVNFHGIAVAMGIIQDYKMGDQCAGYAVRMGHEISSTTFKAGDRVVSSSPGMGSHGTVVRPQAAFCHNIPDSVPFPATANVPVILSTVLYCLVDVAQLQPGETVLIRSRRRGPNGDPNRPKYWSGSYSHLLHAEEGVPPLSIRSAAFIASLLS